jgi:hypothetical protein
VITRKGAGDEWGGGGGMGRRKEKRGGGGGGDGGKLTKLNDTTRRCVSVCSCSFIAIALLLFGERPLVAALNAENKRSRLFLRLASRRNVRVTLGSDGPSSSSRA